MHYNSIEHFLTVHAGDLVGLMEEAQQATGGFFARLDPAESRAAAEHEAARARQALLTVQLNVETLQQATRTRTTGGISLADARRLAQEIDTRLRAWAAGQLADQPALRAELERRVAHLLARYRASVTAVQIDDVLQRLPARKPDA
jgi:hypothetical protein